MPQGGLPWAGHGAGVHGAGAMSGGGAPPRSASARCALALRGDPRYTCARMNGFAAHPLIILLGTQALFTTSDFMARFYMKRHGFDASVLTMGWFWLYQLIRQVATVGQLYVFSHVPLGKTMALFGATSIVMSNVLGFLFLKESLSPVAYAGVGLAVLAIFVMAFR